MVLRTVRVGNVKQIFWTEIRNEAYERADETSASQFCSFLLSVFFCATQSDQCALCMWVYLLTVGIVNGCLQECVCVNEWELVSVSCVTQTQRILYQNGV